MSPYGAFRALVIDATPPTLISFAVTPGWLTVVFWSEPPPPPPPPDFDPDDALPHAVATSSSTPAATISRRVPRTRIQHPPVNRRRRRSADSNVRFRAQPGRLDATSPQPRHS